MAAEQLGRRGAARVAKQVLGGHLVAAPARATLGRHGAEARRAARMHGALAGSVNLAHALTVPRALI